jgi:hypothetical protein
MAVHIGLTPGNIALLGRVNRARIASGCAAPNIYSIRLCIRSACRVATLKDKQLDEVAEKTVIE